MVINLILCCIVVLIAGLLMGGFLGIKDYGKAKAEAGKYRSLWKEQSDYAKKLAEANKRLATERNDWIDVGVTLLHENADLRAEKQRHLDGTIHRVRKITELEKENAGLKKENVAGEGRKAGSAPRG